MAITKEQLSIIAQNAVSKGINTPFGKVAKRWMNGELSKEQEKLFMSIFDEGSHVDPNEVAIHILYPGKQNSVRDHVLQKFYSPTYAIERQYKAMTKVGRGITDYNEEMEGIMTMDPRILSELGFILDEIRQDRTTYAPWLRILVLIKAMHEYWENYLLEYVKRTDQYGKFFVDINGRNSKELTIEAIKGIGTGGSLERKEAFVLQRAYELSGLRIDNFSTRYIMKYFNNKYQGRFRAILSKRFSKD